MATFMRSVLGISSALWLVLAPANGLAAEDQKISEVEVQSDAGVTRIVLRGANDPIYTAFMREDPPRLIVDLPGVAFEDLDSPMAVGDGVVDTVTLGAFGSPHSPANTARVSVGLSVDAEYELLPRGKELVIELRAAAGAPMPAALGSTETPAASTNGDAMAHNAPHDPAPALVEPVEPAPEPIEVPATAPAEPAAAEETPDVEETPEAPEAEAAPAAAEPNATKAPPTAAQPRLSTITEVKGDGDAIEIRAKGPIDNVDSFELDDPARIVLDFWGAKNGVWPATFPVDSTPVSRVRIGNHPDKVRVVLDLAVSAESHVVEPTADGVRVVITSSGMVADPEDAASEETATPAAADDTAADAGGSTPPTPEAPAAPAEPTKAEAAPIPAASPDAPAEVVSVHFESLPTVDRVVVTLTGTVEARLVEPDPATVIVDMMDARIAPRVERRVQTREFGGPVEVFSAFQTPEVSGEQVRLVVKRSGATKPRIDWDGAQLRLEIPRGAMGASPAAGDDTDTEAASAEGAAPESAPGLPAGLVPLDLSKSGFEGPADPAAIDVLQEGGFRQDKDYQGRRISLDFKDADVANIMRLIAEVSDLNIIAGEEVKGKVTIRLIDVPWDQALDIILLTKGLGFIRIGNILRIAPVKVLQKEEQARLQERRAKEKLEDLVVKLQPVNYASVKEVRGLVKKLLSSRGTVNIDKRTSTLIIKDIPSVIHEAVALVKAVDTQTPQVLIEAKIVEASLDFARSLGTRWGIGYNANGGTGGAPDLHLGDGSNDVVPGFGSGNQSTNFITALEPASALGTLTLGLLGLNDRVQLDLQLQAAESTSKSKIISSPRVLTLNNRQAKIKQGVAIRFDASDGDSVSTSFVDAVLELSVTPHITQDRSIIMQIKVSRNSPQLATTGDTVVGIAKNETATQALVRDGQTMVLGGIYTVDKGRGSSKVPFLADIPLIGVAFKNSNFNDVRRELLIFVTPRIVQGTVPAT